MSEPIDVRDRDLYAPEQLPVAAPYRADIEGVVLPRGEIEDRVAALADEIATHYADGSAGIHALCVLKGAMRFFTDLLDRLETPHPISEGAIRASRYGMDTSGGEAEIEFLQPEAIAGKDVLVIEDIVDEGHTLQAILDEIQAMRPNSVEVAVLLDKPARRVTEIDARFRGFVIPDEFVVGYGLDYAEQYRDLRHLAVLDPSIYGD